MKTPVKISIPVKSVLITLGALIFLLPAKGLAQTSFLADQYLLNPLTINPAIAGIYRFTPIAISTRQQWMGMKAAPSQQSITAHTNLKSTRSTYNPMGFLNKGKNSFGKVGIGGGIYNFSYGAISQIGLHFEYAYHVFLRKGRLSFGLAPLYHQYIINKSNFILPDGEAYDPVIHNKDIETLHFLDFNAGVHIQLEKFFAGFSLIQLFNSGVQFGSFSFDTQDVPSKNPYLARSIYAYAGFPLPLGDLIEVEPALMARYNFSNGFAGQLNMLLRIADNFETGIFWKYQESYGLLIGAQISNVVVRYLYEMPYGTQMTNRFTSHQILAGFNLNTSL